MAVILSTGQGQVTRVHHKEKYMNVVRHVLWVVCDVKYNGHGIFYHLTSRLGKKGPKSQILTFKMLNKTRVSDSVLFQDSNDVFCFGIRNL